MTSVQDVPCPALPVRDAVGHKGTFGRVLLIGGSIGMSGSVCLSAVAALRSGSGLVSVAVPESVQAVVASFEPSYMTLGLPVDESGALAAIPPSLLQAYIDQKHAIGIGPGLGQSAEAAQIVASLLGCSVSPMVLDADALNVVAGNDLLRIVTRQAPCVITPHPGEFARLSGLGTAVISAQRRQVAADFAAEHNMVVVLKGPQTVVTDGCRVFVNSTGNSGMATGGSGDVLTGIVTSLLGQGMQPFEAAAVSVFAHGLAGDLAAKALGQRAMIASDLLQFLSPAWRQMEAAEDVRS